MLCASHCTEAKTIIFIFAAYLSLCYSFEKVIDQNSQNQWYYDNLYFTAAVFITGAVPANHHSKSEAAGQPAPERATQFFEYRTVVF